MKYIDIPHRDDELLPFYLAAEEYVARYMPQEEECFFMWQVNPTVIFGRNQLIENEVNLDFCRTRNIRTFRRKSGGGCVYADRSNVMFSYINSSGNVQFVFDRYVRTVARLLRHLGLNADATGRNDILIDGKKVSGNAFYHLPGRNIVHGTMLYDTDMENMIGSITPNDAKLVTKGVKSVRQHICLLKDYLDISLDEFKQFVRENLCNGEVRLNDKDVEIIRNIEEEYLTQEFIYGRNPRSAVTLKKRIDGCGDFETRLTLKGGKIKGINLMGDFFLTGDIDNGLYSKLEGVDYKPEAVAQALENVKTEEYIMNLTNDKLITLLFQERP